MHWWITTRGYIEGRVQEGSSWRRIKQHRWVMEQHLGRHLLPSELVHHNNGLRADNRVENLSLYSRAAHALHHNNLPPGNGAFLMVWQRQHGPWNKGRT